MAEEEEEARPPKKAKQKEILDVTALDLQSSELREKYLQSKPYQHIQFEDFCDEESLRSVQDEITSNLKASYKETDLFKVYQVPQDLATLEDAEMKHLAALRDALYSEKFRKFVQKVTGCGQLSERVDCSANAYAHGGHLLCHDDVIGTRAVSYILYLTAEDWNYQEHGGAVELYETNEHDEPTPQPVVRINPSWNSLLIFQVAPGKSFHSVQEVYRKDAPRLSISGWFHHAEKHISHTNESKSSREQQRQGESMRVDPWFQPGTITSVEETNYALSEAQIADLKQFIKLEYMETKNIAKLRKTFCESSAMVLNEFLRPDIAQALKESISDHALGNGKIPDDNAQITEEWILIGPPHKQRYLSLKSKTPNLWTKLQEHMQTLAFRNFIAAITGVRIEVNARSAIRRFRPGLDYTVAYGQNEPPRLDMTLCLLGGTPEDKEVWSFGDVGGFCALYDTQDENDHNPDVYQNDEDKEDDHRLLSLPPEHNALAIVLRDPGFLRFIKFVSNEAPGSRVDIDIVAEIHPDDLPDDASASGRSDDQEHNNNNNNNADELSSHDEEDANIQFYAPPGLLGDDDDDED